jgi:hypothetical protein
MSGMIPTPADLAQLTGAEMEEYEERAAIIEYNANEAREYAQAYAYRLIIRAREKPIDSKPLN